MIIFLFYWLLINVWSISDDDLPFVLNHRINTHSQNWILVNPIQTREAFGENWILRTFEDWLLFLLSLPYLANCPGGWYYDMEKYTCVECPVGTFQPSQGKKDCIPCGKNLTTFSNGTEKELDCIGKAAIGKSFII